MTEETNIQPIRSDFEQIRKTDKDGQEYWSARELATALGYSTWQKFNRVLNKALQVAQNRGMEMSEHFNQMVEMVKLGSGSFRKVENWHLSRMAHTKANGGFVWCRCKDCQLSFEGNL